MPKKSSRVSSLPSFQSRTSDLIALKERGYVIGKKIGKGSYATVMSAEYRDNDKRFPLACKVVDKSRAPTDFRAKFLPRELEIITKLEHPNIIQIHSILQRGPKIFIFMRHAENGDLLNFIQSHGPLPEYQAKIWFNQMVKGIKYLHEIGIAHRDLKCENVLISKNMNVKIADFGFARDCQDEKGNQVLSKTFCGSAAYAAPEVVSGKPYNPKMADIWSLGIILFIMLNASMPFDDSNLHKLLRDQNASNYHFVNRVETKLSSKCKALVNMILDPNVDTRWTISQIEMSKWLKENAGSNQIENNLNRIMNS